MAAFPNTTASPIYIPRPAIYLPRTPTRPRYPYPIVRRGFSGLSPQNQSIANAAASAAVLTGTLVGGPLGGAIAGAIAQVGMLLANVFAGCGQTCVEASNLANQAEPLLLQNLQTYMSAPVHYASLQAGALNNFALTWQALGQACSNPQLGAAGQRCISDRQQGACHYKTSPGGWNQVNGVWQYTYPGASGSGDACWNWFVGYHDPISSDPTVVPDPTPAAAAGSSILSTVGISPNAEVFGIPVSDLLLPALLLFGALVL
jgi:hypothetical protein